MGKLINIDNGGTLTDIWLMDGGRSFHAKTLTTPYDLTRCFFEGLKKISRQIYGEENLRELLRTTDHIRYSTTQGTNALVQRKGPRLGLLLTDAGDVERLQVTAREREMFDALIGNRVAVLPEQAWKEERLDSITAAMASLSNGGASRIIVSAGTTDGQNSEAGLQKLMLRTFPGHLLGTIPVLYAGEMTNDGDFRRRTWSAIFNAFLHPAMELFLYHAEAGLRDYRLEHPLLIFRNDGASSRVAKTIAVKTYSSGPRGGAEALKATALRYGFRHMLMMDVGGTTTDFGEVLNGEITERANGEVEGVECAYPLCHIVSIGAGGGSIFQVDRGVMRVGPESVGAAPGPACFGLGGTQATLTDAMLVLGVLDPATYFGGDLRLDGERAARAVLAHVGQPLSLDASPAAIGMVTAFARKVAEGIGDFTTVGEDTVLLGFGGGGPMCALACAEAAGIRTVLVPRLAAVYSAFGIGFSDIGHRYQRKLNRAAPEQLSQALDELVARARADMFSEGFDPRECEFEVVAQQDALKLHESDASSIAGRLDPAREATLTVRSRRRIARSPLIAAPPEGPREPVSCGTRTVGLFGALREVPVLRIEDQPAGARGHGPAIVEEAYFTCCVIPGWTYEITAHGDLLLRREPGAGR